MNIEDVHVAKKAILRCLTEDFTYGKTAKGAPLKRPKRNQAVFRAPEGYAVFNGTDLEMVMDKVVLGLYFALADGPNEEHARFKDALERVASELCHECEAQEMARAALNDEPWPPEYVEAEA